MYTNSDCDDSNNNHPNSNMCNARWDTDNNKDRLDHNQSQNASPDADIYINSYDEFLNAKNEECEKLKEQNGNIQDICEITDCNTNDSIFAQVTNRYWGCLHCFDGDIAQEDFESEKVFITTKQSLNYHISFSKYKYEDERHIPWFACLFTNPDLFVFIKRKPNGESKWKSYHGDVRWLTREEIVGINVENGSIYSLFEIRDLCNIITSYTKLYINIQTKHHSFRKRFIDI